MGRIVTPTYRVEVETNDPMIALTPFAWWRKEYGAPTRASLERFCSKYNASFAPGGCNAHAGRNGRTLQIAHARLVKQATNTVVAEI